MQSAVAKKKHLIVPALAVLFALGFAVSIDQLSRRTSIRDMPLLAASVNANLFLDYGLVPAVKRIENVLVRGGLAEEDVKELAFAVNDLKAHILEVTFQKTDSLREVNYRIESWKEEQWIEGTYYISKTNLKIRRIGKGNEGFLLTILPKMDAEESAKDAGFVRVLPSSELSPLNQFGFDHPFGDLGRMRLYRVPIPKEALDSKGEVQLELVLAAKQEHPFSMYCMDTRPYSLGIGKIDIALHFGKSSLVSYWPGVFDTSAKHVTLKNEGEGSGWKLVKEESCLMDLNDGLIKERAGCRTMRSTLRFSREGAFDSIPPIIVGYWQ